jgi:hypothetical protein
VELSSYPRHNIDLANRGHVVHKGQSSARTHTSFDELMKPAVVKVYICTYGGWDFHSY